jgi:hypothetical protein
MTTLGCCISLLASVSCLVAELMGEAIGDDACSDKCRAIGCFDRDGTSCRDAL